MAYGTNVTLSGSVRSNLLALQNTKSATDVTNSRLNTGKKVNTVIDDAVAFFSAKALDDRAADFNDRKANIDQGISTINAALNATDAVDSLIKQLKGIVTSAKSATATERGTLQTQFNTVKSQIDQLVADASYQGLNLVNNSTAKLTVQFSERSSSRLDVTAQRLTTYRGAATTTSQALSALNATALGSTGCTAAGASAIQTGSGLQIRGGAAGIYYVAGVQSTRAVLETYTLVRYTNTDASVAGEASANTLTSTANGTGFDFGVGNSVVATAFSRADAAYIGSRETAGDSTAAVQTAFNVVSGLNIFLASQIYIVVGAEVTGSFAVTTVSTGTLWSAAAFDPSSGLASDQFTEALSAIVQGLDSAISQNNSVAKALGTNVAILNTRLEFTKEYVNVQKDGAGKLTLADTNEEGANLVSLQTRQQLGIQALQFAGQSEQSVLRLFG